MAIAFPIDIDEVTNKFHVTLSESTFEYIQFLFFVYPNTMVNKDTKLFRENHLLDFGGQLKLTLRELDVFCSQILGWEHSMEVWQGAPLEDPFKRDYDQDLHKSLLSDVSSMLRIFRPNLAEDTSLYSLVEK